MTGRFGGKVAIVTGAGTNGVGVGIGKAISIQFAREGAEVLLVDKFEDRANDTLAQIEADGAKASVLAIDLTEPGAADAIVAAAVERFGGVDIVVNNAAVATMKGLVDEDPADHERVMAVNINAPIMLCRAAIPVMIDRGGGAILNISSVAAVRGTGAAQTAYSTSKAAMLGMVTDIACNYGKFNIRANSIIPGGIDTPMRAVTAASVGLDMSTVDLSHRTALGFEGDSWDVARAAAFLCSDDARYITGVHLPVDGGTIARSPI